MLDTHCHLTHERFREDRPEVLARAVAAGLEGVVCVASELEDSAAAAELTFGPDRALEGPGDRHPASVPWIRTTCGIHPHHADGAPTDARSRILELLDRTPTCVAIGECGLDFHYDHSARAAQFQVFDMQIELAAETERPLVVHCRGAEEEMKPRVRDAGAAGVRGVLHCFPGDMRLLEVAVSSGWMVSFTGLVTFRSFAGLEAVRAVPSDRYMLETDGPYLAPVPHRGERNEPAFVSLVRDRVAEIRDEDPVAVERDTDANAHRFFDL